MRFFIVDAFTEEVMGGNTAGVVLSEEEVPLIEEELMKKTAMELKYNITVFVKKLPNQEFSLKFFSPAAEVDLCGHATIAAFTALLDTGWAEDNHSYIYHTTIGAFRATIQNGFVMIEQGGGRIERELDTQLDLGRLYEILGINCQEVYGRCLDGTMKRLYPALVSTGLSDLLVPVESLFDLNQVDPDNHVLRKMSGEYQAASFHVYCLENSGGEIKAHCRNFAPLYGVREDIATGTSSASLAYYLAEQNLLERGEACVFIQGEQLGRPSKILSRVGSREDKVLVGGKGAILVKGQIRLS